MEYYNGVYIPNIQGTPPLITNIYGPKTLIIGVKNNINIANSIIISSLSNTETIIFTRLKSIRYLSGSSVGLIGHCPNLKHVYMISADDINEYDWNHKNMIYNCPKLRTLVVSTLIYRIIAYTLYSADIHKYNDLIHLEIGEGTNVSLNQSLWNPVNALSGEKTDLIEDVSLFSSNLEQFLYNFKTYFMDRTLDRHLSYLTNQTMVVGGNTYDTLFGFESDHQTPDLTSYSRAKTLSELHCLTQKDIDDYGYDSSTTYYEWISTIGGKKLWSIAYA